MSIRRILAMLLVALSATLLIPIGYYTAVASPDLPSEATPLALMPFTIRPLFPLLNPVGSDVNRNETR